MIVVSGVAPRTGTSFVMHCLKTKGYPVYGHKHLNGYTVRDHNPDGYYDLYPYEANPDNNYIANKIVKLWCPSYYFFKNIDKFILLERKDKDKQLESMRKVYSDEKKLPLFKDFDLDVEAMLDHYIKEKENILKSFNVLHVYTEDLGKELKSIYSFIGDL